VLNAAYDVYLFVHSFTRFVYRFEKLNEDLLLLDAKVQEFDKRHDEARSMSRRPQPAVLLTHDAGQGQNRRSAASAKKHQVPAVFSRRRQHDVARLFHVPPPLPRTLQHPSFPHYVLDPGACSYPVFWSNGFSVQPPAHLRTMCLAACTICPAPHY
jgi:hypothetical protein